MFSNLKFGEAGSTDFSVRVVKCQNSVLIGAAIETAGLTGGLHFVGWVLCRHISAFYLYALGNNYHTVRQPIREVQVVTVRVDVAQKQIVYLVDGVPFGPPHTMNISDADIQKLKPAVQTYKIGDILELV